MYILHTRYSELLLRLAEKVVVDDEPLSFLQSALKSNSFRSNITIRYALLNIQEVLVKSYTQPKSKKCLVEFILSAIDSPATLAEEYKTRQRKGS
ncbi:hypothetical protein D3C71_1549700 [compost metagenome]